MSYNFRSWISKLSRPKTIQNKRKRSTYRPYLEELEDRRVPATSITQYHVDTQSTGANLTETQLTSSNVNATDFGQLYNTTLDGQVYAEPLVVTNVTITAGANTVAGAAGTYDSVVFVATQHDSLYAINAANGAILWHRTFLDTTNSNDHVSGATSVTSVPSGDTNSGDINPEIGITGTPVIDLSTNILYVDPKTKETVGGSAYYVQRLHAINLANGTDAAASYVLGTTTGSNENTNNTQISVAGTGDGNVNGVVQFNALREANRPALSLVNGNVYLEWASHGDNGPYHGWVVGINVSNLATSGMVLSGFLCTDPNGGEGGIWGGGGGLTWDPDEAGTFYFETGNGDPRGGNPPLNAQGFPSDDDYYESVVKVVLDSSTSSNPNSNGWGMHITDYFTPSNVNALDDADEDFGSGSPLVLPDSAGIPGYPHLMVAAGKDGRIFLIDRDNMGKFNANGDNVLNAVYNSSTGVYTAPTLINGSLSTPAYYHGVLYWVSGYNNNAQAYVIAPITNPTEPYDVASIAPISETANGNFGYVPGSVEISANGTEDPQDAVVWIMDTGNNELHAYSALSLSTELWNSGAGSIATVKFATPDVANGEVFVGTQSGLQVFGLTGGSTPVQAPNSVSNLSAQALSGSSVELHWTDSTVSPNFATNYAIQRSTSPSGPFTTVANAGQESTSYTVTGLSQSTTYYFQVVSSNGAGSSSASSPANATTTSQSGTTPTAPVGLGAVPASGSEVYLNWTNTATNATGFTITRATDSLFTQNVVTETIASAPYYYTDFAAGLSPGNTYYYKIQASNSSGLSSSSNTAIAAIPNVPPAPTNAAAVQNGNSIEVSWTDHAGPFALGYQISRSIDGGPYVIYADRPETSDSPPSTQTFTDTNVPLGHTYSYEIVADNVSGFSDPAYASASILGSATLTLDNAGNLAFTVAPGAPDQVTVQLTAGVYTLTDIAVSITVSGAGPGFVTQNGVSSVTIPAADVSAMTLDTSDNTDTIRIISDAVPITITADSGGGDPTILLGDPTNDEVISGTITNASNGDMTIAGAGATTISGNLVCQGHGGVNLSGTGAISITGDINLGASANLTDSASGNDTISGVISGTAASGTGIGQGLIGAYFNLPAAQDLIQPAATSNSAWIGNQTPAATATLVGPIDFPNIQQDGAAMGFTDTLGNTYYNLNPSAGAGDNNNVEARWSGFITIPGTGTTPVPINFATSSDDGSTLYVDGSLVVNNNFFQGVTQRTGLVDLTPGLHAIDIEYYQGGGGAAMDAQWDPTGGTNFVDIPNSAFTSIQSVNGLIKTGNGTLTLSNTNTYVGTTTINAGTLLVTTNGAMGPAGAAGVVVNAGGDLAFAGGVNYTTAEPVAIIGTGPNRPIPAAYVGFTGGTGGANSLQDILNWTYASGATNINYSSGFATNNLTLNGGASVVGTDLQLTDGNNNEARTAWTPSPVPIGSFTTTFQWTYGNTVTPNADGFTFAVQNSGANAVGAGGGGLAYNGISGNSFAAEFNLYNGVSTFGVGVNGAVNHPIDLTADGIDFHANPNDVYQATITDDGMNNLTVSIWDTTTNTTATPNYTGTFSIAASGVAGGGAIQNLGGSNTFAGNITLHGNAAIGSSAGTLTLGGSISAGANTLTVGGLSGTTTNLNGNITSQGGAGVILDGAGVINIAGNINLGTLGNITDAGSGQDTISGVISGSASVAITTVQGLVGTYFNINSATNLIQPAAVSNPAWLGDQTPAVTAQLVGPIDFPDISANGFADSVGNPAYYNLGNGNNNQVEARWYGYITIPGTGTTPVPIDFATSSDDGSMLYIDGNAVVSNNAYQGVTQQTGLVDLTPGLHTIDVEYYNGGGGAAMDAEWDPSGGTNFVDIPNSAFSEVKSVNGVTKTGAGTLTLSNTNTYIGATTISAGTLIVTANGAMGPAGDPGITVKTGGALAFMGGVNYTTAEPATISGSGPAGDGAIENISGNNSFAGHVTVLGTTATIGSDAGSLTLTGNISLGLTGNLTATGAGNITITGVISGSAATGAGSVQGLIGTYFQIGTTQSNQQGMIQPDAASNPSWLGNQTPAATVLLTGAIDFPNISANGFQDNLGTTYYNFGNNNNNTEARWYGDIIIPGTGTAPVPISFETGSDDGSMLYVDGNAVVSNNYYQGVTNRSGTVDLTPGLHTIDIEWYNGGGGAGMFAKWDPTGGTNFVDIPNTAFVTPAVNSLTKTGAGILTLSNTNTYVGPTTINAGTLVATANGAMGPATDPGITVHAGGALAFSGNVNYTTAEPTAISGTGPAGNGAIENISGTNSFAAPITVSGNATIGSDAGTLHLTNSTLNLPSGDTLTKDGAGELTLSNNINAYNGATIVAAGDLSVTGAIGSVTLTGGVLGGSGTVGAVTNTAGTINPGLGASSILNTGSLSFGSTGVYAVDLNGITAGTSYDKLNVTGSINLTGGTLEVSLGYTPAANATYTIIHNVNNAAITGTFAGLPQGGVLTAGGLPFEINYTSNAGHDVTLTQTKPTITTTTLPNWTVGRAYSQAVGEVGGIGAVTFAVSSGSLPAGLSLNTSTGAITGTPSTTTGSPFSFTITATDSIGATASEAYTVTINPVPSITTTTLPDWTVGQAYNQTVAVSDGTSPYLFAVITGSLPTGLSLNTSTGAITGTPSTTTGSPFNFTLRVTDAAGAPTSEPYTVTINPAVSITTTTLPSGTVGTAYNQTVGAAGGTGSLSFSVSSGSLPAGLSLDTGSGAITGTPTTATGSPFSFTITATDSVGATASQAYTVSIVGSSTPITIVSRTVNGDLLNVTSSISSAVESAGSTSVQITTSSADGLYVGELVSVTGVGTAEFNGTYTVASVIDSTDFTYTDVNFDASSPGSISNGGTAVNALGGAQRSMVDSITYVFNQAVTLGTGAISMDVNSSYTGPAGALPGTISYATIDDGHTWLVTFSGANVTGNSIADGEYDITLNASAVSANSGGGTLAASQTDTFYRLFGDSNGDASVTSRPDVQNFAASFGSSNTTSAYLAYFDYNADGSITSRPDVQNFATRFGTSLTGLTATI